MIYREKFAEIFFNNIKRKNFEKVFSWLESSDFFKAPASARFHCSRAGGLVEHSVKVYEILRKKHFIQGEDNEESFAVCALLHDICKVNFYRIAFRNVKNVNGVWEKQPFYSVEDAFPYGHGEKSVFIIERFMKLTTEEAMAIRWHMAGFDDSVRGGSFSLGLAFEKYPLCVKLSLADLESTYLYEKGSVSENIKIDTFLKKI